MQTTSLSTPGLIEVYPHPALLELASASERLPYKHAKCQVYWPKLSPAARRVRLMQQWRDITDLLDAKISGVKCWLPEPDGAAKGSLLKAHEDMLDAIVCSWVGICALEGGAIPFGDHDSAIWIPSSSTR